MNKAERGKRKNAGCHWESNPGPLTSATSPFTTELQQPDDHQQFTILYTTQVVLNTSVANQASTDQLRYQGGSCKAIEHIFHQ